MNEDLEKVQDIFLERINKICREFGLNNIMAQLYAILYLSNKSLSLNDMVDRLKISKGSVSINIRALERYGAVRRIWLKGSRRDYYEAETDISKVIMDRIRSMAQRRLSGLEDMINVSYKALNSVEYSGGEEKEAIKVFKQRLDKIKNFQGKAQSLFNILNSGLLSSVLNNKSAKNKKESDYATSLNRAL